MNLGLKNNRIVLLLVATAVLPLLFGAAFHGFFPCTPPSSYVSAARSSTHCPCCPFDSTDHEDGSSSCSDESCPICDFLAMPRDFTAPTACEVVMDLLQRQEFATDRFVVVLYRAFEHGRAPPNVV